MGGLGATIYFLTDLLMFCYVGQLFETTVYIFFIMCSYNTVATELTLFC